MKILLLEDDFSLNKIIVTVLRNEGYFVDTFVNGNEAIKQLLKAQYDLCIFDINVPYIDGHMALEFMRKEKITIPVIIMSAMTDVETIKHSYSFGCDDYLKKPFELEELLVRVAYSLKHKVSQENSQTRLTNGYVFDVDKAILYKNGNAIDLSVKETLMLALFVSNIGNTVSLQMLRDYVWNGENVETVSIRTIIHKLKSKLNSGMIINIRGVGYKLIE